jgi:trimeric autotransporter adhesin
MKATTLPIRNSINYSPLQRAFILIPLVLMCFAPSPEARAVVPAPDGGYPGFNTAEGTNALFSLTSGAANTAIGFNALFHNTTGGSNTGTGFQVLFRNTTGFQNAATGWRALFENTTGFHNTASGFEALFFNTTGNHNTADGDVALAANETGNFNTAAGAHALRINTTGSSNTALGFEAGFHITGNGNVCIGEGIFGLVGENNVTRIRNIGSTAQANSVFVTVGAGGKLGRQVSSRRYKEDIKPMDKASEALFALKPVTFHYKKEIDPAGTAQFGLVAEDVEKVNPALVVRDKEGNPYSVRYDQVNAMLLNEFLKEHRKVEEQETIIWELKATTAKQTAMLARQEKAIATLTSQVQKVSARLETQQAASRLASE